MATNSVYEPLYTNSWALVIGINEYDFAPPLSYACNDADKFADIICNKLSFPEENITILKDKDATKQNILSSYLEFTSNKIEPNDRVIVFFAGHGLTRLGSRGEVGFLVPIDGNADDIKTLIRWAELTGNSELVPAKHILFIMDACYGGLAVQRYLPPGSMRFAKDMLQRFTRQVLTAGKADEVVSDSGGPRQGHSVFTGHLLDALEGAAVTTDGLLTANGIMSYVYDRVAKDYQSNQTPHYGFLDGDGDMILDLSPLEELNDDKTTDKDILIEIPANSEPQVLEHVGQSLSETIKEYISDSKYRIKLHDTVLGEVQKVLALIGERSFPVQGIPVTTDEFSNRLRRYETIVSDLATVSVIITRWGGSEHRKTLEQIYTKLPDTHETSGGVVMYLGLRWYPLMYLLYSSGITALAAENYENLVSIFLAQVGKSYSGEETEPIILPTVQGMLDVNRANAFKQLPGHDRHYVPMSEYLFKVIQPCVEDLLFLGRDYERLFDKFEVLLALVYADQIFDQRGDVWGPVGRFGWKFSSGIIDKNPFEDLVSEASIKKNTWEPLQAGFFNGSHDRFVQIANGYRELLNRLSWY